MKTIKIAALKDQLSKCLRAVEAGQEMEVTDRNRVIVRLVPASPTSGVAMIPAPRPFVQVRRRRFRPAKWQIPSLDMLREERGRR